jgi:hypothetical protein
MISKYNCSLCNKIYSSYQSLWIHNKKFHKNNENDNNINSSNEINKLYKCKYCNKIYLHKQSKYKHQLNCSTEPIDNTLNTNNIINTNIINNTINNNITNNIIINKVGYEDIYELTQEELTGVLNNIYDSIHKIIKVVNFNERLFY